MHTCDLPSSFFKHLNWNWYVKCIYLSFKVDYFESSISLLYKMGSKRNNVYSKLMPRKCASRPKKTQKRCVYLFYVLNNNGFPLEGWKNWGERLFWALSATYTNGVINCWTNPGRGWGFRQQHTQMKQNLGIIDYFLSSWKLLILIHTAFLPSQFII